MFGANPGPGWDAAGRNLSGLSPGGLILIRARPPARPAVCRMARSSGHTGALSGGHPLTGLSGGRLELARRRRQKPRLGCWAAKRVLPPPLAVTDGSLVELQTQSRAPGNKSAQALNSNLNYFHVRAGRAPASRRWHEKGRRAPGAERGESKRRGRSSRSRRRRKRRGSRRRRRRRTRNTGTGRLQPVLASPLLKANLNLLKEDEERVGASQRRPKFNSTLPPAGRPAWKRISLFQFMLFASSYRGLILAAEMGQLRRAANAPRTIRQGGEKSDKEREDAAFTSSSSACPATRPAGLRNPDRPSLAHPASRSHQRQLALSKIELIASITIGPAASSFQWGLASKSSSQMDDPAPFRPPLGAPMLTIQHQGRPKEPEWRPANRTTLERAVNVPSALLRNKELAQT